jgi:6-phosphogluconolactonase
VQDAAEADLAHATLEVLPAGLSVFRVGTDGKLDFVRKYDIETGIKSQFWAGMVTLA